MVEPGELLFVPCQDIRLEGVLSVHDAARGTAAITHPHPQFGGDMDNPVVRTIESAFRAAGFTTLRFNFRGTGQSGGQFDGGDGEQEDVRACLDYLKHRFDLPVFLIGYSFGAWVNARLMAGGYRVGEHILVSPPVAFIPFTDISSIPYTRLVITGELDAISPPGEVRGMMSRCCPSSILDVIPAGDHFYSTYNLETLSHILAHHLNR